MNGPQSESAEQPEGYRRIIALENCPANAGVRVVIDGYEVAVFRLTDPEALYVIDNECPHEIIPIPLIMILFLK